MKQMIKIILVSSDKNHYSAVRRVVSDLNFQYESDIEFLQFGSISDSLKKEICNLTCKKVYILNVKLCNENFVFNLAKFIRKCDWNSEIILVKGQDFILAENWQRFHKLFDVVNLKEKTLGQDIRMICNHNLEGGKLNYRNRDINLNIYYDNILYVYRDTQSRKLVIITENGLYNINMDLKDIFKLLDGRFRQVHQSCIVNTSRTEKFDWPHNKFILDTGDEINMLSKHYRNNIDDEI